MGGLCVSARGGAGELLCSWWVFPAEAPGAGALCPALS